MGKSKKQFGKWGRRGKSFVIWLFYICCMKLYPSKLLLFGEHTVNIGSSALAIPLPMFSGYWDYLSGVNKSILEKEQMQLPNFAGFLFKLKQNGELLLPIDSVSFKEELQNGLIFKSNIPTGYGVGSSGALVAAIADRWGGGNQEENNGDLLQLKQGLAQMESFFHGTSSGTDPLICFLQKPLLLGKEGIQQVGIKKEELGLFLIDTGIERKATPYIEYFLTKMESAEFANRCESEYIPFVESAIGASLSGKVNELFEAMNHISEFQFQHLEKMIPDSFKQIWREGMEGNVFKLKICGAGGGGFILGVTKNFEKFLAQFPNHKIIGL